MCLGQLELGTLNLQVDGGRMQGKDCGVLHVLVLFCCVKFSTSLSPSFQVEGSSFLTDVAKQTIIETCSFSFAK